MEKITLIRQTTLMWDCPELQPTLTSGSDVVPVEKTSICYIMLCWESRYY